MDARNGLSVTLLSAKLAICPGPFKLYLKRAETRLIMDIPPDDEIHVPRFELMSLLLPRIHSLLFVHTDKQMIWKAQFMKRSSNSC